MGLYNVLIWCWICIRLIFRHTMSITKNICSYIRTDLNMNFCRRSLKSQPSSSTEHAFECHKQSQSPSSSSMSFVTDFVKRNLKSVTTQIIQKGKYSDDICKVEHGNRKSKRSKKKFSRKAGKNTENSSADIYEISDESPKHNFPQRRQKEHRPNYFVAVQVTDPKVLENTKRIQDSIIQNSSVDLKHMKVDIKKCHITLMAMHLADSLAINSAITCLDQCLPTLNERMNFKPVTLEFEGLSVFSGGSVLFVTVKPSPALQSLISISDVITRNMKECGITASGKDFNPHMTLMKYRWKKQTKNRVKRVEKDAYTNYEKEYIGSQTITSIQLCRMEGVREDGYYIVEHEVFFNR